MIFLIIALISISVILHFNEKKIDELTKENKELESELRDMLVKFKKLEKNVEMNSQKIVDYLKKNEK